MKKFTAVLFALSLMVVLALSSFAASQGDLYWYDPDDDNNVLSSINPSALIPGRTYYVYIDDSKPSQSSAKSNIKCYRLADDKSVSLIGSSMSISKRKYDDSSYGYFAAMPVKEIPISSYSEDGYYLTGGVSLGSNTILNAEGLYDVAYETGGSDITKEPLFFSFDDTTETLVVEDSDVFVTVNSEGVKTKTVIGCDTTYKSAIGNKYEGNLEFYDFGGATVRNTATIEFPVSGRMYLYELKDNKLTEITRKNSSGNYEVKSKTLGSYVVSDTKLSASAASSESSGGSSASSTPTYAPVLPGDPSDGYVSTSQPTGGYVPVNPTTGAVA